MDSVESSKTNVCQIHNEMIIGYGHFDFVNYLSPYSKLFVGPVRRLMMTLRYWGRIYLTKVFSIFIIVQVM